MDPIKTIKDRLDSYAKSPGIITAGGRSFEVKDGGSQRESQVYAEGRGSSSGTGSISSTNPDVPAGHYVPTGGVSGWMRTASRRPTGKRAQRARNKPWRR